MELLAEGPKRVIGLTGLQYVALLIGLLFTGWLIGGWFRRK